MKGQLKRQFTAASLEAPLSAIVGKSRQVSGFGFALNEMCGPERGSVLRKIGERRTDQYHFGEAAMQPYVILRSMKEDIISEDVFNRFYVKRQTSLAILTHPLISVGHERIGRP